MGKWTKNDRCRELDGFSRERVGAREEGPLSSQDVPFEFEGEIARASAVAEAGDVEGGTASARHGCCRQVNGDGEQPVWSVGEL